MKLNVPCKVVGNIDIALTGAILNKIESDDWFVYDYRKPQGNMQDCRSILFRHSSEYSTATIREMPMFQKFECELIVNLYSMSQATSS